MERSEILSLVIASQEAAENAAQAAAQAIREIDVDGDGTLTLEEMEEAASKNPKVRECVCAPGGGVGGVCWRWSSCTRRHSPSPRAYVCMPVQARRTR